MISRLAAQIAPSSTLVITAKANELKSQGVDVIGFGAGEPDFDTPEYIKKAAIDAIMQGFTKYTPAAGTVSLRKAIATKLQNDNNVHYSPEQIVVNNGAKHSLVNAFMAILNPEDEVIIPAPYWLSYPEMVKIAGGKPVFINTQRGNDFKLQPEELEAAINDQTKALVINSPSNPTGVVYTRKELEVLAHIAVKHNIWIISDEIYEYLVYGEAKHTCIASLSEEIYKHTITINGLSKSHSMTGWRIGYLAAPIEVAKAAANIQSHATSNPNSIAQKAAEAAILTENDFVSQMVREFANRRDYMYGRLTQIKGLDTIKPQGAFYCFIDVAKLYGKVYNDQVIASAADFADFILEAESVALVPCADFGTPDCIRLSYAISQESIAKGLDRIESFIKKLQ
ncbi:pyridoxal phosphate-dependent aminotransferase [Cellulosilyticum sp. I15G10I2]|uniref:pyridoxal phosphate-dependent aminotransferase n=1 Tax=Cellulosilyticum sp. I15G10I2 TaxID=1892843 RepID=UPI000B0E99C2|nr:pyridoxal phosphate-dependent aminotransferase [Cellulosilyticum sp. I15G10I2]